MYEPGDILGGCRLLKECGSGAFGSVFLAENATTGQRVALKILPKGGKAIFLLNVNILAGKSRFQRIYSRGVLKELYLFSSRIVCAKNGDFETYKSSAVNYAWFVFEKGFCGSTLLHWI